MPRLTAPPLPTGETQRLEALRDYAVLDTAPEASYDDITRLAAEIAGTPIALVSLVDKDRQWFKSRRGLDAMQTSREHAFCAHAILRPDEMMVVPDALADPRFRDNPLVTGAPGIRYYAGAPLLSPESLPLGTLCVIDTVPRTLSPGQLSALQALSRQTMVNLELRRINAKVRQEAVEREAILEERVRRRTGELERALQEIDSIGYAVSHDMRTPIRAIHSFCSLLAGSAGKGIDAQGQHFLARVVHNARLMGEMIDNLIYFMSQSRGSLAPRAVDMRGLAQEVADTFADHPRRPAIRVGDIPPCNADPDLVRQVWANLIGNAVKFTREGSASPQVEVGFADGAYFVRDDGIGFDPAHARKLFTLFERLNPDAGLEGTGVGLAVVRKIVERHGGSVSAEGSPGGGATFHFSIPG